MNRMRRGDPKSVPGIMWVSATLPSGKRMHVAPMGCSGADAHWVGTVEDPDRCDCDRCEGICTFCRTRQDGGMVLTKVTACYRSAKSALDAISAWDDQTDKSRMRTRAPWDCPWSATVTAGNDGDSAESLKPLLHRMFRDGTPAGRLTLAEAIGRPPRCDEIHAGIGEVCADADVALFPCRNCGEFPEFGEISVRTRWIDEDHYGMPGETTRQWIIEHSDMEHPGDVQIPSERRGGLFTHVRYVPKCECRGRCVCDENEPTTWLLDEYVAKLMTLPPR